MWSVCFVKTYQSIFASNLKAMRILLALFFLFALSTSVWSQPPTIIPYQAVARNGAGEPIANAAVDGRFTLHENSFNGPVIWQELQTVSTNAFGHFSVYLGNVVSLSTVSWSVGNKFLQIELDLGSGYIDMGTQQLLSVPYALHSASANAIAPSGAQQGQVLTYCEGEAIWTYGGICPASVTELSCDAAVHSGLLWSQVAAEDVSTTLNYSGGNGASYTAMSFSSTGVEGLTATLSGGTLASGEGSIEFSISGTPNQSGQAEFNIQIGNQSCTFSREVGPPLASVDALDCAGVTFTGTIHADLPVTDASFTIGYSGGNGGYLGAMELVPSNLNIALFASHPAIVLNEGAGSLTFTIAGSSYPYCEAVYEVVINGQTCEVTIPVEAVVTNNGPHSCGAPNVHNTELTYGTMTDQEGNIYKTIVIGTQEWMAENLNTSIYRNGDSIATNWPDYYGGIDPLEIIEEGSWAYLNNDESNECPFGKLYDWYACTDARQLCPSGWHVPSYSEVSALVNSFDPFYGDGFSSSAGIILKSGGSVSASTGWWPYDFGCSYENVSGFSALPGGFLDSQDFLGGGSIFNMWSSTDSQGIWILAETGELLHAQFAPYLGLSVRCIRD